MASSSGEFSDICEEVEVKTSRKRKNQEGSIKKQQGVKKSGAKKQRGKKGESIVY